jgi:hypothetical protein
VFDARNNDLYSVRYLTLSWRERSRRRVEPYFYDVESLTLGTIMHLHSPPPQSIVLLYC